ncbi:hypothetical protein JCM16138_20930 [Thermococcus atlanticus]
MEAHNEYPKDEIREMILSWEIMDAVKMALEDRGIVLTLLELLKEKDEMTKTRALLALSEVLKRADEGTKFFIVKHGLDVIIDALKSKNENISMKAAQVLIQLVKEFPLKERDLMKILDAVVPLIRKSGHELVLLEIAALIENIQVSHPSPHLRSRIARFISCRNPRIKAMGLRLLLNLGMYGGDAKAMKLLLAEISDLLSSDDVPLVEFSLNIIQDSLRLPVTGDIIEELSAVLVRVKNLVLRSRDFTIRMKARETLEAVERAIYEYYRSRPEEAKKKIHKLLLNGFIYEAIDLAIAVGDRYVLEWLHEEIMKRGGTAPEFRTRFISGVPYVLTGRKGRKMRLPTLSELRSPKKPPSAPELHEEVQDVKTALPKAIEDEDVQLLLKLLRSNPEAVGELSKMLRSDRIEERIDGLWAVYAVSSRLNRSELGILHPLIPDLFSMLSSRNAWARGRAAKILALLSLQHGEIVPKALELLNSNPLSALEFFSYYFTYTWDDETGEKVLNFLKHALKDESLQFDALLTLEAIASKIPADKIGLLIPFIPKLKRLGEEGPRETQKIAVRILDQILGERGPPGNMP